ncbi:MAG: EAL domain-containing protein [Pseudomonadota bacterium]
MHRAKNTIGRRIRRLCITQPRKLWIGYALGFLVVFATVGISHWASLATIKAAENDAEVLSVSSRQRVLSQRILFLMSEMERGDPMAALRLEAALNLFEISHNWLVGLPDLSPELRHLYFEKEPMSLDAFSRRFVHAVGIAVTSEGARAAEMRDVIAEWSKEELILSLASASTYFRDVSEAKIARLQRIQHISLAMALIVLLIEGLVIFLPAQVSVNQAIAKLEVRKKLLRRSLSRLKEQNDELRTARQSLTHAANHDALTGLANRRAIYHHLVTVGEKPGACDLTLCVMKIDLDHFKDVNDTLGHNAGDRLLACVASVLCAQTGDADTVGRIGGDEFVIVIEEPPSLAAVQTLGEQIVSAVAACVLEGAQCKVSASVGFTIASVAKATPDQMLIEADLALYEAKRDGRGKARAYSDALAAEVESRRILFREIRAALSRDEFEPFFQPQISLETGALYGCEVLARWRHPDHGLVSPSTFIAAAEEAGLVHQIDHVMIEKGLDFLERCRNDGLDLPSISINASPATLRDPHLTERLVQAVRARHLSPRDLTVEVLEDTLIESEDDVAFETIKQLLVAGCRVVLDDFGTGYASMSNLSRLELDGIKIDQSLVKPVPDPRADSIIAALVSLTQDLGMKIIAEGVETDRHCAVVSGLGCSIVQGFAISKPLPEKDFLDWHAAYHNPHHMLKRGA